ncbi:MAG: hypothetical protein IPP66_19845 [Anaerolineales bacterium]|nr:hypothetical protein [Anaerolineales bacterium]
MGLKKWLEPERLDIVIAILIALVSLTTSLAAWRTNVVGSNASDANRQGLIDAVRKSATQNENWRVVYQEAGFARDFVVASAAVEAMDASNDESLQAAAATQRQYLLPSMQTLSDPLGTEKQYRKSDGTFDLEKRFANLEAEDPKMMALDPLTSFHLSDQYSSEQRWLTIGTVLLVISLFWLGVAELTKERARMLNLAVGLGVYLFGIAFLVVVEIVAVIARGGVL